MVDYRFKRPYESIGVEMENFDDLRKALDQFTYFVGDQSICAQEIQDYLKDDHDESREAAQMLIRRLAFSEVNVRDLAKDLGRREIKTYGDVEAIQEQFDLKAVLESMRIMAETLSDLMELDAWENDAIALPSMSDEIERFTNGAYVEYAKQVQQALDDA